MVLFMIGHLQSDCFRIKFVLGRRILCYRLSFVLAVSVAVEPGNWTVFGLLHSVTSGCSSTLALLISGVQSHWATEWSEHLWPACWTAPQARCRHWHDGYWWHDASGYAWTWMSRMSLDGGWTHDGRWTRTHAWTPWTMDARRTHDGWPDDGWRYLSRWSGMYDLLSLNEFCLWLWFLFLVNCFWLFLSFVQRDGLILSVYQWAINMS